MDMARSVGVPVPRVIRAYESADDGFIIEMEHVPGVTLKSVFESLSSDELDLIGVQMRDIVDRLQTYVSPDNEVGPIVGNSFPVSDKYVSLASFHDGLCKEISVVFEEPDAYPLFQGMFGDNNHKVVFTHNDLFPRNIIIDPTTLAIQAVLDWEYSGFYPEYWEYAKLLTLEAWGSPWGGVAIKHLRRYPREYLAVAKVFTYFPQCLI
ncbi:kinase-like domain-containing protein [Dimargaris cristalligena]|uniref:Kinase-like domain-containing protein n=1 Tax=Dimargaris cristalligena TaxID=215637 RepID=A0A4P9ZN60_9FUNG|nr:kinase-like domain-containing protein [Dimargaris cristalligena]|eukprot:RKP33750.1 kinase-like domain-containing protein [Dimargaris cristalligena]